MLKNHQNSMEYYKTYQFSYTYQTTHFFNFLLKAIKNKFLQHLFCQIKYYWISNRMDIFEKQMSVEQKDMKISSSK